MPDSRPGEAYQLVVTEFFIGQAIRAPIDPLGEDFPVKAGGVDDIRADMVWHRDSFLRIR